MRSFLGEIRFFLIPKSGSTSVFLFFWVGDLWPTTFFLDQPPLFWSVINMVIWVELLVITQFVVVDFPIARNGSIALIWGLVPTAVMVIIVVMHIVSTFFNVVIRFVRRICVLSRLRFVALDDVFCHTCRWRCLTTSRFAASFLSREDLPSRLTYLSCKQFWCCSTTASISLSFFYDVAISGFDASSDACFVLGAEIFTN